VVPNEINQPGRGGILIVGRDPGADEVKVGRPFVGLAGKVLADALGDAGLDRDELNLTNVVPIQPPNNVFAAHKVSDITLGRSLLDKTIKDLAPKLIITCGNEASYACIPKWPSRHGTIATATGIEDRRGYIFEGRHGHKVLPIIHPAATLRSWVPWRILTTVDLTKAKKEAQYAEIRRPTRKCTVVRKHDTALKVLREFNRFNRLACDIEITDRGNGLSCIGLGGEKSHAFVFVGEGIATALSYLHDPGRSSTLVFCNGMFDAHFLLTRVGVRVSKFTDDIQLAWHSCYPELAGASSDKDAKRHKHTRKALSFLASIYTNDAWWKDYAFKNPMEQYTLNAIDVCVTLDVMEQLDVVIDQMGVRPIYNHTMSLVWPAVEMQARGLEVDNDLRRQRIRELRKERKIHQDTISAIALPLIKRAADSGTLPRRSLFESRIVCKCCRGGSKKRVQCWGCAGYATSPSATLLKTDGVTLTTCKKCKGVGKWKELTFNPKSTDQKKILLYDILKFKVRRHKKKVSVDEEKLRDMLSETL
jgi:DNA polymerase